MRSPTVSVLDETRRSLLVDDTQRHRPNLEVIYQAADYRLFDTNRNRAEQDPSTKAVVLETFEWTGFVTYTGIGRVGARHTSDFVQDWITAANDQSFAGVVEAIRTSASRWIHRVKPGHPQTFVVAGFIGATATAAIVSNFERWHGADAGSISTEFFSAWVSYRGRPEVLVTGIRQSVPREQRRALQRVADHQARDPARFRRTLASTVASAAERSPDRISRDCFVYSQDSYGRGHEEVFGSARTTSPHALPATARHVMEDFLDEHFGPGRWTIKGATFASSRDTSDPPENCTLTLADRGREAAYRIVELPIPDGRRAWPRAVNADGLVVGEATPVWRGPSHPCSWPERERLEFLSHLGGLGGQALAINDNGCIVGHSGSPDGASKACVWRPGAGLSDIGSPLGRHSGAKAINARGDIAGFASIHPEEGGQAHVRPALWPADGTPVVLKDLGGQWGEAVQIDEHGMAIVRLHSDREAEAAFWDGTTLERLGQMSSNVRAFYPYRLTRDGNTVGTAILRNHSREIAIYDSSGHWTSLGDSSHDKELMAVDSRGTLVGREHLDYYSVPWIWRWTDEAFAYLPHYRYHHSEPTFVSDQGWIVGSASSDNCSHPVLWLPLRTSGALARSSACAE